MFELLAALPWARIRETTVEGLGHTIAWIIIGIGFVGTFLPVMPGPSIIMVGALVHFFWLGEDSFTLATLIVLAVLLILAFVIEYVASAMGAKWFGSTKWGVWGAVIGGVVGIFWGLPGLLAGPLLGVFVGEFLFARQRLSGSVKSTWGTLVGTAAGILIKAGLAAGMVIAIVVDLGNRWW